MTTPISVGEWSVIVAHRHEHLLECPITGKKCGGEKCELWSVTDLECGLLGIAKAITTSGG